MRFMNRIQGLAAAFTATLMATPSFAQDALEVIGKPVDRAYGFQPAATELARDIHSLDTLLLWICAAIVVFVVALLAIVIVRYNSRSNPKPAIFTHNTPVEVIWTVVPIVILVIIGAFSLPVLFKQQEIPVAEVTIKATGNQWYWDYSYPDHDKSFSSIMLTKDELPEYGYSDDLYLLATDTAMVVPVNKIVVVQVTAADVIHSWAMPAFGVKQDGVPGRLAELWFKAEKEGVYFGQCSELCGKDHAYMPITVKVVSEQAYEAWLETGVEPAVAMAGAPAAVKVAEAD